MLQFRVNLCIHGGGDWRNVLRLLVTSSLKRTGMMASWLKYNFLCTYFCVNNCQLIDFHKSLRTFYFRTVQSGSPAANQPLTCHSSDLSPPTSQACSTLGRRQLHMNGCKKFINKHEESETRDRRSGLEVAFYSLWMRQDDCLYNDMFLVC